MIDWLMRHLRLPLWAARVLTLLFHAGLLALIVLKWGGEGAGFRYLTL